MDDLDRLYFELVEGLRARRPGELNTPLTVVEVCEELIPYRQVRDRVGFDTNGDYEATLSRLLAGERQYLLSEDSAMQESLKEALEAPVPDLGRFRTYPHVRVWLNPEEIPPPGDTRYAPPELRDRAVRAADRPDPQRPSHEEIDVVGAEDLPEEAGSPAPGGTVEASSTGPRYESPGDPQAEEAAADGEAGQDGSAEARLDARRDPSKRAVPQTACPHCETALPERATRYCPFCGFALEEARCARCGAPLERAWRYCSECGAARGFGPSDPA